MNSGHQLREQLYTGCLVIASVVISHMFFSVHCSEHRCECAHVQQVAPMQQQEERFPQ